MRILPTADQDGSAGVERHRGRGYGGPTRWSECEEWIYTRDVSRIAIGSDHAGYLLKQHFIEVLHATGVQVTDLGTHSTESVDYPPICAAVGRAVRDGEADLGIVIGGSGQGEQLAANKVRGVRAALCNDLYTARMARLHNDANVLSIGARVVGEALADEILTTFLLTAFEGGRHQNRVDQISAIEQAELELFRNT